jgi:hypothetical protein
MLKSPKLIHNVQKLRTTLMQNELLLVHRLCMDVTTDVKASNQLKIQPKNILKYEESPFRSSIGL